MRSMRASRGHSRGFTMIEIVLALMISAFAITAVALVIRQLETTGDLLARESRREDGAANGARMLADLVGRIDMSIDSTRQFQGHSQQLSASSWCEVPGGWMERCALRITLDPRQDSTDVAVQIDGDMPMPVLTLSGAMTFRYFTPEPLPVWAAAWGRGLLPPFAVGLVGADGDTLVLRIGERG